MHPSYIVEITSKPEISRQVRNLITLMLALIVMIGASAYAEPENAPEVEQEKAAKKEPTKNLTECPDCTGKVSKRATMCPHCGCPGEAIKQAVYRAEQAARPKTVARVVSDSAEGYAVAVKDGDATYVVFDAFLLANSIKLELHDVRDGKMISYNAVELAEQAGLLRLKVTSDQLVFKSIAKLGSAPAIYLDTQGFVCPSGRESVSSRPNSRSVTQAALDNLTAAWRDRASRSP